MTIQTYSGVPSRNLIRAEMQMLKHAEPIIVLGAFGTTKEQPKRKTDTVVFRRVVPFGASSTGTAIEGVNRYIGTPSYTVGNFVLQEGVNPDAQTLSYVDVSVTLQNYGILYKFSSKVELMYEDDVPADMSQQTGEAVGEISELIRYGVVRGGTNVIYANGSSRSAVNTAISLGKLRSAARTLRSNRARMINSVLSAGPDFGTSPVEAGYVVFAHTDMAADIRNLPGFTKSVEYASGKKIHENEIGAVEEFRFVLSPLFSSFAGAGSATINGMVSVGGSAVDVYPVIIIAQECWGSVALKGQGAITPTVLPSSVRSHANPLGMFGFVGASFWTASVRLNEAWMVRLECAASTL